MNENQENTLPKPEERGEGEQPLRSDHNRVLQAFRDGLNAYKRAREQLLREQWDIFEPSLRLAAKETVNSLELAMKVHLRYHKRQERIRVNRTDYLRLRNPNFDDLITLLKAYGEPPLDDDTAEIFFSYREMRNEVEHGGVIPSIPAVDQAIHDIGKAIIRLLQINDEQLPPKPQLVTTRSGTASLVVPELKAASGTIADADRFVRAHADTIKKIVFPHRKSNPIAREQLSLIAREHTGMMTTEDEFGQILSHIIERNLIPGLIFDGFEAYLFEEHSKWKREVEHEKKMQIGRKAAGFVQNGMKVFLDAGSTTEELVKVLVRRIENRALTRVTIATTSVNIAAVISDCCVRMGFDDDFSAVRLLIPGGQVRPGTQAIVAASEAESDEIVNLGRTLKGFDIGFVGVNGIDINQGFTTHTNAELQNKTDIINICRRNIIVGDSSKIGIVLEQRFAGFEDQIMLVVDSDPDNFDLRDILHAHPKKVVLA
ncbi:MAG: hypothetical protein AB7H90_05305 [Alphaproteobacteria bacterium]